MSGGATSRRKGSRGQNEAAKAFESGTGIPARNGAQAGVFGGMDIETDHRLRLEAKRCEQPRITTWLRQAERDAKPGQEAAVLWRGNRMGWRCIVPVESLGEFCEAIVAARRANGIQPESRT